MSETHFRPLITVVRRAPDDSEVEVTLDLDGWIADGVARVEDGQVTAAAARATCTAVNQLLPDGVEVDLATAEQVEGAGLDHPVVLVGVRLLLEGDRVGGELLGAAYVRGDPQVATVRATLDGLTRRLTRFLQEEVNTLEL